METLKLSQILVEDRLRKDLGDIEELASSIQHLGLIQPLVLNRRADGQIELMAGGRRYTALKFLGIEDLYHGSTADPERPGYVFSTELPADVRLEVELEENIRRKAMDWKEEVKGVCKLHRMWKNQAILAGVKWFYRDTGDRIGYSDAYVTYCLDVEPDLDTDDFKSCESLTDAVRVRARQREDSAMSEIARRSIKEAPSLSSGISSLFADDEPPSNPMLCVACTGTKKNSKGEDCPICKGTGIVETYSLDTTKAKLESDTVTINLGQIIALGDCTDLMFKMPEACVDHIITDPPYAIDMANLDQSNESLMDTTRVDETHDVEQNLKMFRPMLEGFYRVVRPHGYCLVCCDITNWELLFELAQSVGFRVQRWPLVWHKLHPCKNQMAHVNFTKDTELVMVMGKPGSTLPKPIGTSVVSCAKDPHQSNPFAKPFEFWKFLIESVSIQGQTILDPFAGEGSGPISALRLGRKIVAIEKDEKHFPYLLGNVKKFYVDNLKLVKFI